MIENMAGTKLTGLLDDNKSIRAAGWVLSTGCRPVAGSCRQPFNAMSPALVGLNPQLPK
jgi:hypothetical protein